jgi:tetratricopeptide (TPR) repeat protein
VNCTNCRAEALVQLGRRGEAGEALETALAEDPEDSHTHANKGWALLHAGQPKQALEHFKEALRIDPENEWARAGIVEALKARNFLYRWLLAYFLWMSRLSAGMQWGIILGGYFLIRFLGSAARENPALGPYVLPIQIIYMLFAILTWTAPHLFNLLLRLDKYGRYALSDDQIMGANCVGGVLLVGVLLLGAGIYWGSVLLAIAGLGCIGLMIPVGGTFTRMGRARLVLGVYTLVLVAVGLGGVTLAFLKSPLAGTLGGLFALGLFFFGLVANAMATR